MKCNCVGHGMVSNIKRQRRIDPQQLGLVRRGFLAQINRRFGLLKKDITRVIVTEDGFGLSEGILTNKAQFNYPTSSQKVDEFMRWLKQQQKAGVLQVGTGRGRHSSTNNAWSDTYISAAYDKGVRMAGDKLSAAGVDVRESWLDGAFNRPIHADAVGLAYTRTFNDLEGITNVMDQQISRALAESIGRGDGARATARRINERVDGIGITRARTLARTELATAHHKAGINSYREAGAEGVTIIAEFSTTGDERVCEECEALEGKEYSLEEADSLIPVHPNCRCATKPVVKAINGVELS